MGNKGGAVRRRSEYTRLPCMQRPNKDNSQNLIWVPKIPSWEKEFVHKIGQFTWEKFLEAKKETRFCTRILEWDDGAAEEAFHRSKMSFLANESCSMSPDLYIDDVVWEEEDGASLALYDELESAKRTEQEKKGGEEEEDKEGKAYVPDWCNIRIEDIKPTGWDCEVEEYSPSGLVICCCC